MEKYNFDEEINRFNTNSLKWDNPIYKGLDILPMPVADMDFPMADELRSAIKNIDAHGILGYSIVPDSLKLAAKQKIFNSYQWETSLAWQVWIPGIVPGLTLACSTFLTSEQSILIPTPIYHPFHLMANWVNRPLLTFKMIEKEGRWVYDFEEFENQLKKQAGIFLFCNPHNPGGTVFTLEEIKQIIFLCKKYHCMIISDEIHADLQIQELRRHICIGQYVPEDYPIISFFATSKTYNTAGLGGAVAIIPDPMIRDKFIKHTQGVFPMLSRHSVEIIETSLTMPNDWLVYLLEYLRTNHHLLVSFIDQIEGLKMLPLEATYLAWIEFDPNILGDFQHKLFLNGLHVFKGEQFLGENFIRMNIACTKKSLERAFEIIRKTINESH